MAKQVEEVPTNEEVIAEAEQLLGSVNRTIDYLEKNPDFLDKAVGKHHSRELGAKPLDG